MEEKKSFKIIKIIGGWIVIFIVPYAGHVILDSGFAYYKGRELRGVASWGMIALYFMFSAWWGGYAVNETLKILRKEKPKEDKQRRF